MSVVEVTYYQAVCDRCGLNLTESDDFSAWSVVEVTYYQAVCDRCGLNLTESDDFSAWSDGDGAIETALAAGARSDGGDTLTCWDCQAREERDNV